jgi:HTH-type transcriptional regulator / antitoxin HipB
MHLMPSRILSLLDPTEVRQLLADRARALRLEKGWTRQTLASKAGVSAASLKRYETTGKGSIELVLKVAHSLARLDDFKTVFEPPPARSIEDLETLTSATRRKRGRI